LERLEAAFTQVQRFSADAAHELRTPLTALRGGIEVILRSPRSAAEYREALDASLEDVNRLIRLAEDLLLLSRSSSVPVTHASVDLGALVLDVLDTGAALARETGVTVLIGSVEPATVAGDGSALRRVLLNLVENGVKYTPAGGTVELSLARAGGWATVT